MPVELEKISSLELSNKSSLPFAVYAPDGSLLLAPNHELTPKTKQRIIEQGYKTSEKSVRVRKKALDDHSRGLAKNTIPSEAIAHWRVVLSQLYSSALSYKETQPGMRPLYRMAGEISSLSIHNTDFLLGSLRLAPFSDTIHKLIETAVYSAVIAHNHSEARLVRDSIILAALTSEIGSDPAFMDHIRTADKPLSRDVALYVRSHPFRAENILKACGVDDEVWLRAVADHHERQDRSGYRKTQPCLEGEIIGLSESLSAMQSVREYKAQNTYLTAVRKLLDDEAGLFQPELIKVAIRSIGLYQPGTGVKLKNNGIGIVVSQSQTAKEPNIVFIANSAGGTLSTPKKLPATKEFSIASVLGPDGQNWIREKINPGIVWMNA